MRGHGVLLVLQQRRRAARDARVKHDRVRLQLLQSLPPADDGLDAYRIVRIKFDEIKSAERGGVLVLLADGFAAAHQFDLATFLGQPFRRCELPAIRIERVQQPDRVGAGGAQSRAARRDVRDGRDLDATLDAQHLQCFAHERMFYFCDGRRLFRPRITDADVMIKFFVDGEVNKFVDRRGKDGANACFR